MADTETAANTYTKPFADSVNLAEKSVEMISNAITEMHTIYHRLSSVPEVDYMEDRLRISKMLSNEVKVDSELIKSDIIPILRKIEMPASKKDD